MSTLASAPSDVLRLIFCYAKVTGWTFQNVEPVIGLAANVYSMFLLAVSYG